MISGVHRCQSVVVLCVVGVVSAASIMPSEAVKRTITFSKSHILTALFPAAFVVDDTRCKLTFKGLVSASIEFQISSCIRADCSS